jgi:1,4-alpha-glucan branching enzyme
VKRLGSFGLVLHAHLPYVLSHGTWPHGTDWLNEAAAETYIPLLNVFNRLKDEGMSPRATVGLTPVLTEMLASGEFKEEFKEYLNQKKVAAGKDIDEFTRVGEAHMVDVARMWHDFYESRYTDFTERYGEDLVGAYRRLQDEGHIEIITCGATHGYFPLLSEDTSIQAQVKQGISSYRRHFGKDPVGMWLPECAYRPSYIWTRPEDGGEKGKSYLRKGIEEFLSENGIKYFFIDSHLLKGGKAIGVYLDRFEDLKALWSRFEEQFKPLPEDTEKTPYKVYWVGAEVEGRAPVAVFTRDPKTGTQVWSGEWGYPGDGNYLDFHKKKFPGGLKYWEVTNAKADLADKGPYYPENAYQRLPENAGHFKDLVKDSLREHLERTGEQGIVVSPFDAELFGHWWFEGPEWIYNVIKYLYLDGEVRPVTTGEYLAEERPMEVITLPEGSWGEGGYHWIWLNDMNKWTWKHVYEVEEKMHEIASRYGERKDDKELQDILKQAARELMLLVSSDWQFLISTRAASDYADGRIVRHYEDFKRLAAMAEKKGEGGRLSEEDMNFLKFTMTRDGLFPDIDPLWFKEVEFAARGEAIR